MRRLLTLFLVLLLPGAVTAEQLQTKVKVGILDFPGFAQLDESGELVGKTVTLSHKLITEAGYDPQFKILPAARIWEGLKRGQIDIWPGVMNKPDMEQYTLLTERDLGYVSVYLYHRSDTPPPVWPEGLRGKDVIIITNFTYTEHMLETLKDLVRNLYQSASHEGAVEMLMRGRGDYLLDYRSQVEPVLERRGIGPLPSIEVATQPLRFVLSGRSPLVQQLREDLDAAFDRLQAAGVNLDLNRE